MNPHLAPCGQLSGPLDGQGEVHLCLSSHILNGFMTELIFKGWSLLSILHL